MIIESLGLTVDVPTGWEASIYQRVEPAIEGDPLRAAAQVANEETRHVVAHIANFALPEGRGDYGGGAVELMGPNDLLIVVFEYHPDSIKTALFSEIGVPWPLRPDDFDPNQMQRPLPGQGGLQRFFQVDGRAFCLYVALGALANRAILVENVNRLLEGLQIAAI